MNNSAIPLTPAQMTQIRQYDSALSYPAMYRYMADDLEEIEIDRTAHREYKPYYQTSSILLRLYPGEVSKTLSKLSKNDDSWKVAV
jgi:hypothetical protein